MEKTIIVQGTGVLRMRPNWVIVYMNIENRGKEYHTVMKQANEDLEALRIAVVSAGFGKTSCKTTGFHIDTQYQSGSDGTSELECYVARHGLRMEFPLAKTAVEHVAIGFVILPGNPGNFHTFYRQRKRAGCRAA